MTDSGSRSPIEQQQKKRIHLPRRYTCPVRVRITHSNGDEDDVNEYILSPPFSIGYGDHCEVKLPNGSGPARLFEFAPMENSQSISLPLKRAQEQGSFKIYLDGETVSDSDLNIKPGSSVKILDQDDKQLIEVSVDTARRWKRHLRSLYGITAILFLIVSLIGYLIYGNIQKTEQRLEEAETRLTQTESSLSDRKSQLESILDKFETRHLQLEQSLDEISSMQRATTTQIRDDFYGELKRINDAAQTTLSEIAESDQAARNQQLQNTQAQIADLTASFSKQLLTSMEQFKSAQNELFILNSARIESLELESTLFKKVLLNSQKAVILVKTDFITRSVLTGEETVLEIFGTGFTVGENGLSIAPHHIMRPWLYDDDILVMQAMGMVNVLPDSVRYTIWTAEEQVVAPENSSEDKYQTAAAFSSETDTRSVMLLYAPEPDYGRQIMNSPLGAVTIERPLVGHTDILVFQLVDFTRKFAYLPIDKEHSPVEAMDEIILVGYPLSRLHDGRSVPQGVKGFVRRQTSDLLELDTALHPGSSGAPVLSRDSNVIGMAVALVSTDTYGLAIPTNYLYDAIAESKLRINEQKQVLIEKDCYTGEMDGLLDESMWRAILSPDCSPQQH